MFKPVTLKALALILLTYALALLPGIFWPEYLESPAGVVLRAPGLMVYVFDLIGVPDLLQDAGGCGAGWCAPSVFGWTFVALFWGMVAWLLAWGVAALARRVARK